MNWACNWISCSSRLLVATLCAPADELESLDELELVDELELFDEVRSVDELEPSDAGAVVRLMLEPSE